MNKITIEKAGTVETLTIPDDAIDAVMAELTERFGKRDGFVEENMQKREWISTKCLPAVGVMRLWQTSSGLMAVGYLSDDKRLVYLSDDDTRYLHVSDCVFHQSLPPTVVKPAANERDERDLAQQRLRKAYLAVTGGAEIEGEYYIPLHGAEEWFGQCFDKNEMYISPYRFATAEQAAAFGRDNGDDLIRMMSV